MDFSLGAHAIICEVPVAQICFQALFVSKATNELIFNILFVSTFQILLGFASFFVVSIGGTLLGLLWGLTTAFLTKFTDHVRGAYTTVS